MGTDHPKLMFKIELIKKTDVKFTLLQLMDTCAKNESRGKFHFTKNNWTIYYGTNFSISNKQIISLPKDCLRQETKVIFKNDQERYDFLKSMAFALEDWSDSHHFKEVNKKIELKFHKSLWLVF